MKTILIVDDHADTREVFCIVLEHAGYRVLEAEGGEEGVSVAMSDRPDLIVMDNRLPGMSGSQAAKEIKSREGLQEIPILGVSASLSEMGEEEQDTLIHTKLSKPVRPTELLAHIESILDDS